MTDREYKRLKSKLLFHRDWQLRCLEVVWRLSQELAWEADTVGVDTFQALNEWARLKLDGCGGRGT